MFKKYNCVLQNDKKDCGPACILTIMKDYNIKYSLAKLREIVGTDRNGTNLYGLIKGLNYFNFNAKAVEIENKKLDNNLKLPAIAHVLSNNLYHFFVIQKIKKDYIIVSDPSKGVIKIKKNDFYKIWTGILVLVEPQENIKNIHQSPSMFWKFIKIIKRKKVIINIFIISLIYMLLGLVSSFYFKYLVDYVLGYKLLNTLNIMMIGVIFLTFINEVFNYIRNQLILFLGYKIDNDILMGYYKHILELPINFYEKRKIGEIVSRFTDAYKIRQVIIETTFILIIEVLTSIVGGFLLYIINKTLFLISILIVCLYAMIVFLFKEKIRKKNVEVLENNSILVSSIIETINGISTIKSYNLEMDAIEEVEYKFLKYISSSFDSGKLYNIISLLSTIILLLGNYLIIWIGSVQVIKETTTLGNLLLFSSLLVYFFNPLKKIINLLTSIQSAVVAADRIGEILDLDVEEDQQVINYKDDIFLNSIKFENLSFRYGLSKKTIDNLSLTINHKDKIAIIGESGSGKTTIAKLLMKYYSLENGDIKFGDVSIKNLDRKFIRDNVAYVAQDTFLFNKTIKDNLILNNNIKFEDVKELVKKLNLNEFIDSLPQNYYTIIEENGSNLSGGQKQRISILRALLKKPKILILDEATSNLDCLTEQVIQKYILGLDITVIIIAHRLSTIKLCDKIYVLNKGSVVEFGTHEELMKKRNIYYKYLKEQV